MRRDGDLDAGRHGVAAASRRGPPVRRAARALAVAAVLGLPLVPPALAQEEPPEDRPPSTSGDSIGALIRPLDAEIRRGVYLVPGIDVVVEARRRPERGPMAGFYRRKRLGHGRFITREEIEERRPRRVTDLLRSLPGVGVSREGSGAAPPRVGMSRTPRIPGRRPCSVRYYVDGMRMYPEGGFRLDHLRPMDIQGIEVYRGISEVPIQFARHGEVCGVIVVWTRDPEMAVSERERERD